jgi:hypothetical protein
MIGLSIGRRIARRRKRALWAATLCSASFVTGHVLFGDEPTAGAAAAPSLLSQYLEAKNDLVAPALKLEPTAKKPGFGSDKTSNNIKSEIKKSELIVQPGPKAPVAVAGKLPVTILAAPTEQSPSKLAAIAPKERPLEKLESNALSAAQPAKAESPVGASLRPAAVSAAADLPFAPAPSAKPPEPSPGPLANPVRPVLAQAAVDTKPVVAQASVAVPVASPAKTVAAVTAIAPTAAGVTAAPFAPPAIQVLAPVENARATGEGNLPPILPAGAVPRPGAKKAASTQPLPQNWPPAATTQQPPPSPAYPATNTPTPLRIELGNGTAFSPASPAPSAPPVAPVPPASTKRADINSLQRLPSVVALTPRPTANQPPVSARATSREPLLLPPVDAAQPIPVEIRNPHVAQASYQTVVTMPSSMNARVSQHLDDTDEPR